MMHVYNQKIMRHLNNCHLFLIIFMAQTIKKLRFYYRFTIHKHNIVKISLYSIYTNLSFIYNYYRIKKNLLKYIIKTV